MAIRWRHRSQLHLVDPDGLVGCPRQCRDVPVDECLGCRELLAVERTPEGRLDAIRCTPASCGPDARELTLLGWSAPRRG